MTVFLTLCLFAAAVGWTRERCLRQGDVARLKQAGIELEIATGNVDRLVRCVEASVLVRVSPPADADDDPSATRH